MATVLVLVAPTVGLGGRAALAVVAVTLDRPVAPAARMATGLGEADVKVVAPNGLPRPVTPDVGLGGQTKVVGVARPNAVSVGLAVATPVGPQTRRAVAAAGRPATVGHVAGLAGPPVRPETTPVLAVGLGRPVVVVA